IKKSRTIFDSSRELKNAQINESYVAIAMCISGFYVIGCPGCRHSRYALPARRDVADLWLIEI
ncbi:hypothetical protein, partial [Enterobacter bugandensis]|uniref:hypothetical protein n=1 Tax=Enterobacter bugandensis TaxID=881260 RepID=UPI003D6DAD77